MSDVELKPQVYKDSRPPEEFIHFHERVRDHPPEWIYEVVRAVTVWIRSRVELGATRNTRSRP